MLRLAVRVQREQSELVLAELLELAPSGVEEVELGSGLVEYAVYGASGELPALPAVKAAAGVALVDISTREIADDWAERWRQFHRPLVLDDRLRVRPPWEPPGAEPIDIVIDPGQAFGTGAHATTRHCLALMLELQPKRGSFLDLGCGSGVLAIAALRLGFDPVIALDNDPAAIEATLNNARRNRLDAAVLGEGEAPGAIAAESPSALLYVRHHDLGGADLAAADTVAANLLAPLLGTLADRLRMRLGDSTHPRQIIASGLLNEEADRCADAFAAAGFVESIRAADRGWSALLLRRVRAA